jgi:chorismate mutase
MGNRCFSMENKVGSTMEMEVEQSSNYYIVDKRVLPDVFVKVVSAKRLMQANRLMTVQEAVKRVGLSRSAFYKYRDYVFTLDDNSRGKTITVGFDLKDEAGSLSDVLNTIAECGANVLTINQTIPINNVANVTVTVDMGNMQSDGAEVLIGNISKVEGVLALKILARE